MKIKSVAILGAGPSGLLAAHAAVRAGYIPYIYTRPNLNSIDEPWKSKIYGCQYLHSPIPDLVLRSTTIEYQIVGSPQDYRRKVYGSESDAPVSPSYLEGAHVAWDLREAYHQLWTRYVQNREGGAVVVKGEISKMDMVHILQSHPVIISTIPAQALCREPCHVFAARTAWAIGDAPERRRYAPVAIMPDTAICDGTPDVEWYRAARVFGYTTIEWPEGSSHPASAVKIQKPLWTSCVCWEGRIHKMGRFGEWRKGILASDVFAKAKKLFEEM